MSDSSSGSAGGYSLGTTVSLGNSVTNYAATASLPTSGVFFVNDNPSNQGIGYQLGTRPIEALGSRARSRAVNQFSLASLPSSYLSRDTLYVAMAVNPASPVDANGLDWLPITITPSSFRPDLTPVDLRAEPRPNNFGWGQQVELRPRYRNQGSTPAGASTGGVYLSNDAVFDGSDRLLGRHTVPGVAAGATLGAVLNVTLPNEPPAGFGSGAQYLLYVCDDQQNVSESSELNNVVALPITISGTAPVPGDPTIGSFTIIPNNLLRGTTVQLTADNVTDDGVVNEVLFRLDSNDNRQLDPSDLFVGYGSKSLTTFTLRAATGSWPLGTHLVFAQAMDNYGNRSVAASVSVTVTGNGPSVPDAYEVNDSEITASYLGGQGDYTVPNLSVTPGDVDYFAFDVTGGGNGAVQITLDFVQEPYQGPGVPVGDLVLELRRVGSGASYGFSNTSTAGNTHESITIGTLATGRYLARISGEGAAENNPNYTFRLGVHSQAGAPNLTTLTATPGTPRPGDAVTLNAGQVAGMAPGPEAGVIFFRDANRDGQITFEEHVGEDFGQPDGPNGTYATTVDTTAWPVGQSTIFAFASPAYSAAGLARSVVVNLVNNAPPAMTALSAPGAATVGQALTVLGMGVSDDEAVAGVVLYRDADGDGSLGSGDAALGAGTRQGSDWGFTVATAGWAAGTTTLFAVATDQRGLAGDAVATAVALQPIINRPPLIGTLSGLTAVTRGLPLLLRATGVSDPDGNLAGVRFTGDADGDGVADADFGPATPGAAGEWSLSIPTLTLTPGEWTITAVATDASTPALTATANFRITVLRPRLALATPQAVTSDVSFGLTARVVDDAGQPIPGYTGLLTAVLADGPADTALGGTVTANAVNGVATFTGLTLAQSGAGYQLVVGGDAEIAAAAPPFVVVRPSHMLPVVVSAELYGPHPNGSQDEAYLKGLYHAVLDRDAEPAGLAFYLARLAAGRPHAEIVASFVRSPEYRGRTVDGYYQVFLGRDPEPAGRQYWIDRLLAGMPEEAMALSFLNSPEQQTAPNDVFVQRLYQGALGRDADASGLAYWQGRLQAGATRDEVARGFVFSAEAAGVAVDSFNLAFLHRDPEAAGRQYWVEEISAGRRGYGAAAETFLATDEFYANAAAAVP